MEEADNNVKVNAIKYFIIHGTLTALGKRYYKLVYKLMGLQIVN